MDRFVGDLGLRQTDRGHGLRVWSRSATAMELRLFDAHDLDRVTDRIPMAKGDDDVWSVESDLLQPGVAYAIGVDGPTGPTHRFDASRHALPPHAKGIQRTRSGDHRATVIDSTFDWGDSRRPATPLDETVVYEAHVKGLTQLSPHMPEELRGTYAGLAHPSTIAYLKDLGVTAVQLLPIHYFLSEQRLLGQGRVNYWGYNTLSWLTPHSDYASRANRLDGTGGVLREVKGMVRLLHEAGLEVYLDVVYNHTAEEGPGGPAQSLRLIDDASYYRQTDEGHYIDVTGCGNTVDYSLPAAQALVLDSLRYWAHDVQIDGFRFDLAVTLGRGEDASFSPDHPLLRAIATDPTLRGVKMIAEPWDVGMGGWQVGQFGDGWSEWNDGYRDRVREFWLADHRRLRHGEAASTSVGPIAHAISGSQGSFTGRRGPLASVNLVTAHDGFTLTDLVRYDEKHNLANGEDNRDGTNDNRSYNHGVEGRTEDVDVQLDRRRSMRNVLGTLLVSAGIPMLSAGDEFGRTQRGNNNAYCIDSALTWMPWMRKPWQDEFLEQTRRLIRLRREHPALRPLEFGRDDYRVAGSSRMEWFNAFGAPMTIEDWEHAHDRTVQYMAESTPIDEPYSRVLVMLHGSTRDAQVTLPNADGVEAFELLWSSADDRHDGEVHVPGDTVTVQPMSLRVYRVDGVPESGEPEAELVVMRSRSTPPPPPPPTIG